ncbi:MAG: hypothetical protein ABWZ02_05975 [Nakamurella sp.]
MTGSARPNLGGLFNGSTPPEQASRIADPLRPRLVSAVPIADVAHDRADQARPSTAAAEPQAREERPDWADPVALVNQYFGLLRTLLDLNQQWAVAFTTAVVGLPRRAGLRR